MLNILFTIFVFPIMQAGVQNTLKHMSKKLDTIVDFITTKDDQTEKKQCDKHQLPVFVVKKVIICTL